MLTESNTWRFYYEGFGDSCEVFGVTYEVFGAYYEVFGAAKMRFSGKIGRSAWAVEYASMRFSGKRSVRGEPGGGNYEVFGEQSG